MKNVWMRYALMMCVVFITVPAYAGPPFNVDDPATVERHRVNLITSYTSSQNFAGEMQTCPTCLIAYGYTDRIELDIGAGGTSLRNSGSSRIYGFGDTTGVIKWRFQEETKRRPQLAIGYQIKIPTADVHRGLGSGAVDHCMWISAAKSYGRWSPFANIGYNFLGGHDGTNNMFCGCGITYQVTEKLIAGAQVYGNSANAPGVRDELAWGAGLTYNYMPDKSFLLSLGRSEHGYSDLNVYAGFSITFGKK